MTHKNFDFSSIVAWVGIDWADRRHAVAYEGTQWPKNKTRVSLSIAHTATALIEFVARLRKEFSDGLIAIAIEQAKGGLIHHLMGYGFFVFFRVNPTAFSNYRKSFRGSGAKDDPSDADLLLDYVMKQPERFRPWLPEDSTFRMLRNLVEARRVLVDKRTAFTNHITSKLKYYFPEALDLVGQISSVQACDFLEKWPTLQCLKSVHPEEIRTFYLEHRCRRTKVIQERIQQIQQMQPFICDEAIILPSKLSVQTSAALVRHLTKAIALYDQNIQSIFKDHPDRHIYQSFPGAGTVLQARLAALMGIDRDRFSSAKELRIFTGVAPITRTSGNSRQVLFRYSCPKFLRQTLHEFAACSLPKAPWAKALYELQKQKHKKHHAAVRAVAFKWAAIIYHCWKNRVCYDPQKAQTQKTNSDLDR